MYVGHLIIAQSGEASQSARAGILRVRSRNIFSYVRRRAAWVIRDRESWTAARRLRRACFTVTPRCLQRQVFSAWRLSVLQRLDTFRILPFYR